jgi:hypothetical protein
MRKRKRKLGGQSGDVEVDRLFRPESRVLVKERKN